MKVYCRRAKKPRPSNTSTKTFNISEQDSTKLIEALEHERAINNGTSMASAQSATTLDGPLKTEVVRLLQNRRKLEAVKYVQNHLYIGLNEALMMVEEVEKEINFDNSNHFELFVARYNNEHSTQHNFSSPSSCS